jgi:hypothetical protein
MLTWGVGLIAMGILFTLHYVGLMPWGVWKNWWPALVVFLGFVRLAFARNPRRIGEAVLLLAMGGWFFIASNDLFGLSWHNSWPISIVAIGLGSVARAVASYFWRREERDAEVKIDVQS